MLKIVEMDVLGSELFRVGAGRSWRGIGISSSRYRRNFPSPRCRRGIRGGISTAKRGMLVSG